MKIAYIISCIIVETRSIQNDLRAFETIRFSRNLLDRVLIRVPETECILMKYSSFYCMYLGGVDNRYITALVSVGRELLSSVRVRRRFARLQLDLAIAQFVREPPRPCSYQGYRVERFRLGLGVVDIHLCPTEGELLTLWQNTSSSSCLPEQTEDKWICISTNRLTLDSSLLLYYGWNKTQDTHFIVLRWVRVNEWT